MWQNAERLGEYERDVYFIKLFEFTKKMYLQLL